MFLLICKLYICIQNVFGHIFYSSRLHLYCQFWQSEVQKLAYMLILAAGGSSPYLSSVGGLLKLCIFCIALKTSGQHYLKKKIIISRVQTVICTSNVKLES